MAEGQRNGRLVEHARNVFIVPPGPSCCSPEASGRYGHLFKSLFERSGMCIANLDPELRVLEANADFFRQFDRPSSEVYGRGLQDFLHPSVEDHLRRQLAKLVDGQSARFTEHVVALRPCGATFSGELTGIGVHGHSRWSGAIMVLLKPDKTDKDRRLTVDRGRVLTDVDARILEGVAAGVSTVQMASQLYLSRQGVEYHVSAMLRKLKAPNRAALVSRAYALGILSVGSWPPRVLPDYVK